MTELWEAGKDIYKAANKLISKYHPHLAEINDQIFIYFKEKAATPGGVIVAGKTKKAAPLLAQGLVTENKHKITFCIEIAHDYWKLLNDRQKTALLDHHLCAMTAAENAQTGVTAYGCKPPDFVGFREEVERWGLWRPAQDPQAETLVEQMFGKDDDEMGVGGDGEGDDEMGVGDGDGDDEMGGDGDGDEE